MLLFSDYQMIPWNHQRYVSTNRGLLNVELCRPILVIMLCWLTVYQTLFNSTTSGCCALRGAQNTTLNACGPSHREFKVSKPFYVFKWTNKRSWQSIWGFPRSEITWYLISRGGLLKLVDILREGI